MTFHFYANAVMHKYSPLNTFSSLQHFFKAHKVFGSMTLRDPSTIRHPKKQVAVVDGGEKGGGGDVK